MELNDKDIKSDLIRLEVNLDVVKQIMCDPKLFNASMTDEDINEFQNGNWEPRADNTYLNYDDKAIIILDQVSPLTVCSHPHLRSEYWGTGESHKLEVELEKYLLSNTAYRKVIIMTPQCCREVLKAATREGYALEGILTAATLWRDKVENLIIMSKFLKDETHAK